MALGRTRELKVLIVGDASSAQRALRGLDTSVNKSAGRVKSFATRHAAATGIAITAAIGYSAKAAAEAEKVSAQTEAVLKSTGGVANVTAGEIESLATRIQNYSGLSDEAIQSSENLLLTFTNIRNEAGENNDVFDDATKRIVDMSVAMDKDLNSSAIMVGKALNDPIKGVSALGRAGVQFSEDQKEMITSLVETGDKIGAQKIILKELETQFGDSAKAAGKTAEGEFEILQQKLDNLAETAGDKVVPALGAVVDVLESIISGDVAKKAGGVINDFFPDARMNESIESSAGLAAAWGKQLQQNIITEAEYTEKVQNLIKATMQQGEELDKEATALKTVERISLMAESATERFATAQSKSIGAIEGEIDAMRRLNREHRNLIDNRREIERMGIPGALLAGAGFSYSGSTRYTDAATAAAANRGNSRKRKLMPGVAE